VKKVYGVFRQTEAFDDLFFEYARDDLETICGRFQLSGIEAAWFSLLLGIYSGSDIEFSSLSDYFSPAPSFLELMQNMEIFENLEEKELLKVNEVKGGFRSQEAKLAIKIPLGTFGKLRGNTQTNTVSNKDLSLQEFMVRVERLCENRVQKKVSYMKTLERMRSLLADNPQLGFVQELNKLHLDDNATIILLRFFHYLVNIDDDSMTVRELRALYEHASDFNQIWNQLKYGAYILQEKGLIENAEDNGFSDANSFSLTSNAKETFLAELDMNLSARVPAKAVKKSADIAEKQLFYPDKTQSSIAEITGLLEESHFKSVRERLQDSGMRTGFACLFSGNPGTGKTETVYQIARVTGRDIIEVNIAETKSKWFGESEKQIKAVFDRYRFLSKRCDIKPILLFNEADAVLGKRRNLDENTSGPGQTENAIQNIILQEIENLDGILIATTNMTQNFDKAFERRFLYKIVFEKPTPEARKSIWLSIIPTLADDDATILAKQYDLTGGQIENIARRRTVSEVLNGQKPALEEMRQWCREEITDSEQRRIGFAAE
jgi:hypothetical protein